MVDVTDVLAQLECSGSEFDEISSGEEFEDLDDIDIDENNSDVNEDSDSSDENVPLANLVSTKEVTGMSTDKYKFERRCAFVLPELPAFVPEEGLPKPKERIPIEYVRMFLTDLYA